MSQDVAARPSLFRHPLERARYVWANIRREYQNLPGAKALMRQSWALYRKHLSLLTRLVVLVALPVAIATTYFTDPTGNSAFSSYLGFAQLAMNTALLYAVAKIVGGKRAPKVRQAYYEGSSLLVRMVLLSFLIAPLVLLMLLGVFILAYGIFAPGVVLQGGEKSILFGLAAVTLLLGLYWVLRTVWAAFVVATTSLGPWQAVRQSWRITRGRATVVFLRVFAWLGVLAVAVGVPAAILLALTSWLELSLVSAVVQAAVAAVVLPLLTIYLYLFYQGLSDGTQSTG